MLQPVDTKYHVSWGYEMTPRLIYTVMSSPRLSVLVHAFALNPVDYPTSESNEHASVSRELATSVRNSTTVGSIRDAYLAPGFQ